MLHYGKDTHPITSWVTKEILNGSPYTTYNQIHFHLKNLLIINNHLYIKSAIINLISEDKHEELRKTAEKQHETENMWI